MAFILLILMTSQAAAASRHAQPGAVKPVGDGDTLWAKTSASQQTLKVRSEGINQHEISQPCGVRAREALKQRVLGQSGTVNFGALDHYGRPVGTLHLQGQDVGC